MVEVLAVTEAGGVGLASFPPTIRASRRRNLKSVFIM
jgi:hypothetical protein